MSETPPPPPHQSASAKQWEKEQKLKELRKQNWSLETSLANAFLTELLPHFNKNFVTALAKIISTHLGIQFDREAQRDKSICIKWFDEHYDQVIPFIESNICILDGNYQSVGHQTPQSQEIEREFKSQQGIF